MKLGVFLPGWTKGNPGDPTNTAGGVKMYHQKPLYTHLRLFCFIMPRNTISFKKKPNQKPQQKSQCCMVLPSTSVCWLALGLFRGISPCREVSMCPLLLTTPSSTSPPLHGLSRAATTASSIACCCQAGPASIFAIIPCCSHAAGRQEEKPKMEKRKVTWDLARQRCAVPWS